MEKFFQHPGCSLLCLLIGFNQNYSMDNSQVHSNEDEDGKVNTLNSSYQTSNDSSNMGISYFICAL